MGGQFPDYEAVDDAIDRIGVEETAQGPSTDIPKQFQARVPEPVPGIASEDSQVIPPELIKGEPGEPPAAQPAIREPGFEHNKEGQKLQQELIDSIKESGSRVQAVYDDYKRTKNPYYKEILETLRDRAKVQMPPLEPLPEPPNLQNELRSSRQNMMSVGALWLAIGLGRLGRGGMITALSAYTGVMRGIQQGNKDAAEQEMERYKAAMDYAIKKNKALTDQYNAVIKAKDMELDTKFEALKVIASAEGDDIGAALAQQKNIADLAAAVQKNEHLQDQARLAELQMRKIEQGMRLADQKAQQKTQGPFTDAEAERIARRAAKIGMAEATRGLARSSGAVAQVQAKLSELIDRGVVTEEDVEFAPSRFAATQTEARGIAARGARLDVTVAEFDPLAKQFLDLVDQVERTSAVPINEIVRAGKQRWGGNTIEGRLHIMAEDVKATYQQIMARGGTPTDLARHTADSLINEAGTTKQMRANVDQMRTSLSAVKAAPGLAMEELRSRAYGSSTPAPAPAPAPTLPPSISPTGKTPPPDAIQYLKLHPELKPDFDDKYGKGAADRALSGG